MSDSAPRPYSFTIQTMGTVGHISMSERASLSDPSDEEIRTAVAALLDECEKRLSIFLYDSDVSQLGKDWLEVSPHTNAIAQAANRYHEETSGSFSALLGPHTHNPYFDIKDNRCRIVGAGGATADFGGIAKGYAADLVRDLAVSMGRRDALVSLGGSSMANAGSQARVAVKSPWLGRDIIGTITLASESLSVSADPATMMRRGTQRSHILDSQTAKPATTDLCMVVVCGNDGMKCEALSTAYIAMGLASAIELDRQHSDIETLFLALDGRMVASSQLAFTASAGLADWIDRQRI